MKKTEYGWRWWTVVLRGVLAIVFGLLSMFRPGFAVMSLVVLFGFYAIMEGVLALSLGFRSGYPRSSMVLHGLVSLLAGVIVLLWPGMSALVFTLVLACWALVAGALEIAAAIRLRKELDHEWMLAAEGVVSMLFGVLLFLSPLAGTIVLGLWVGAFALVFGGMLIASGLRLRSYLMTHVPPTGALAA